ncbi:unnamed protein product [Caenorhabditis angaria]|uniref:Uncharacterized protein n=1 Tax=Caenorhabditis angaria TaxID=860376 RepID=A0A9P1J099_9PELO|nr:unnamed protein product [Caenorhabditis angaria]
MSTKLIKNLLIICIASSNCCNAQIKWGELPECGGEDNPKGQFESTLFAFFINRNCDPPMLRKMAYILKEITCFIEDLQNFRGLVADTSSGILLTHAREVPIKKLHYNLFKNMDKSPGFLSRCEHRFREAFKYSLIDKLKNKLDYYENIQIIIVNTPQSHNCDIQKEFKNFTLQYAPKMMNAKLKVFKLIEKNDRICLKIRKSCIDFDVDDVQNDDIKQYIKSRTLDFYKPKVKSITSKPEVSSTTKIIETSTGTSTSTGTTEKIIVPVTTIKPEIQKTSAEPSTATTKVAEPTESTTTKPVETSETPSSPQTTTESPQTTEKVAEPTTTTKPETSEVPADPQTSTENPPTTEKVAETTTTMKPSETSELPADPQTSTESPPTTEQVAETTTTMKPDETSELPADPQTSTENPSELSDPSDSSDYSDDVISESSESPNPESNSMLYSLILLVILLLIAVGLTIYISVRVRKLKRKITIETRQMLSRAELPVEIQNNLKDSNKKEQSRKQVLVQ